MATARRFGNRRAGRIELDCAQLLEGRPRVGSTGGRVLGVLKNQQSCGSLLLPHPRLPPDTDQILLSTAYPVAVHRAVLRDVLSGRTGAFHPDSGWQLRREPSDLSLERNPETPADSVGPSSPPQPSKDNACEPAISPGPLPPPLPDQGTKTEAPEPTPESETDSDGPLLQHPNRRKKFDCLHVV